MNSLLSRALELQRMAHELMYLDTNGSPIYSDEFCRLNKEVLTRSDSLFSEQFTAQLIAYRLPAFFFFVHKFHVLRG